MRWRPDLLVGHVCRSPGADRLQRRRNLRAADRRHLALVREAARLRGRNRRLGQLHRRRRLAADHRADDPRSRLAGDLSRGRRDLRGRHGPPGVDAAAPCPRPRGRHPPWRINRWRTSACHPTRCRPFSWSGLSCCVAMSMPQVHIGPTAPTSVMAWPAVRRCCR